MNQDYRQEVLQTVIEIAEVEKSIEIVNLLKKAEVTWEETNYDSCNGGIYYYTVYIVLDVKMYVSIKSRLSDIEEEIMGRYLEVHRRQDDEIITGISIIPKASRITIEENPHRVLSAVELQNKNKLNNYLDIISEDQLIEEVLMPLFRHLGFRRITVAGHKDKALEYGKDIWMKYVLPTLNVLYFGIQVKKGKLDSSGSSKGNNTNISEILNQVTMMLGHEIFDPELNRKVLVDHAFIIAGGEITKQARNWLGGHLDLSKRSQVMFIERDDILNLYIVNGISLPDGALPPGPNPDDDNLPF